MDELVPDFCVQQDYPIPTSALVRPNKSPMAEEEIMELLWQNGQVVIQSQRSLKKSEQLPPPLADEEEPSSAVAAAAAAQHLFIQEDEMASWLHYPMEDSSLDRDLYSDLFYPPPLPPPPRPPPSPRVHNFAHFSRGGRDCSTVVDSSVTPLEGAVEVYGGRGAEEGGRRERETGGVCDATGTSSPGGSAASISASAEQLRYPAAVAAAVGDRKRKGVDADENECQSEDLDFESPDAKKQTRGSTSAKRSRAAEVHNLSERRRRDRINEKMRALQELIPRCNKSDKASMLDEAIEYLKSLQMQVQMMSMGCGMVPMMFPGVQQFMPPMGMGMGMGMGMEMGMNRPMMPFLPMMPNSALPNSAATVHLGPRFPMPPYHMQSVPLPNPSGAQEVNNSDPVINSRTRNMNQPHMPFFSDPFQQYLGLQQVPLPQNHVMTQPSTSKPGSGREAGNHEDAKAGKLITNVNTCIVLYNDEDVSQFSALQASRMRDEFTSPKKNGRWIYKKSSFEPSPE